MPDRPRPVWLNPPPRKNRAPRKPKPPRRPRPRKAGATQNSSVPFWVAGVLIVLLLAMILLYAEVPTIKSWLGGEKPRARLETQANRFPVEPLPQKPAPPPLPSAPVRSPAPPKPPTDEERLKKIKAEADKETQLLIERTAPKPRPTPVLPPTPVKPPALAKPLPPPSLVITPKPLAPPALPPGPGAPARALPVDINRLDTERIAAYQVALERIHFSCGFIDGDQGMRTQRMLRAYQASRGLPLTGFLDPVTRAAIGEPGEPFLTYTVTSKDIDSIMPKPASWIAKSKATRLGYNDMWELLAEKFHCTRAYLKGLNRDVITPVAGSQIVGPKVFPAAPIPHAASLRISLSETSIEALDADGKIIGFFPCSIAKDKAKRPHGQLTVKVVDPNPDYTFDPALFADASKAEGITHKLTLPPGPRNPVGTTWVGLSLPGYGIHGTPEPENISRTQSHGCFRLANWNAEKVIRMVRVGTPVDVEP